MEQDFNGEFLPTEVEKLKAEVERLTLECDAWRHAAEKGAALCRAVTDDIMDDCEWFDSARDLYDEVISLGARAALRREP
jgi:hypothetical protein